ncbi:MAG: hypothetical protein LQ346_008736 [Caloplaca aetnensis]|nr:MAG: hypothetical protein LQ346_008736 [Caloplaca aetnensis]
METMDWDDNKSSALPNPTETRENKKADNSYEKVIAVKGRVDEESGEDANDHEDQDET